MAVPRGQDETVAVIAGIDTSEPPDPQKAKAISRVLVSQPLLSSAQISSILQIARESFLPTHKALALFLPLTTLRRFDRGGTWQVPELICPQRAPADRSISLTITFEISRLFATLAQQISTPNTLFIFPDTFLLEQFLAFAGIPEYSDKITRFDLASSFKLRNRIAHGSLTSLFALRPALFWPLGAFQNVIYVEESLAPDFSLFMTKVRWSHIASLVTREHGISLQYYSTVPSVALLSSIPPTNILYA